MWSHLFQAVRQEAGVLQKALQQKEGLLLAAAQVQAPLRSVPIAYLTYDGSLREH